MQQKAYFIGGAFDLTSRVMVTFPPKITMLEPTDTESISVNGDRIEHLVPCRVLHYRLAYVTRSGHHVYEYERVII